MRGTGWFGGGFLWRIRQRDRTKTLKDKIRERLQTEDYICRLPREKPLVRYKLRKYAMVIEGVVTWVWA